jgi:serine protease Do
MKNVFILIIIIICWSTSCVRQSGRRTGSSYTKYRPKIEEAHPATVVKEKPIHSNNSNSQMSGAQVFAKYNTAVFIVYTSDGEQYYQGSGFFISASGLAVSNYHVFEGTGKGLEIIKTSNGKEYRINKVIGFDEEDDVFVFDVISHGDSFNYIPIAHNETAIGDKVFAIGSPRGLENTFSSGEISQYRDDNLIQINVPIDHGSSGGALINSYGEVIGITTAGYESTANLNFAVDIKAINRFIK